MHNERAARGVAFGLAAYFVWGFFPIYFKLLGGVPPLEILCHRIVWSVVFLIPLCIMTGKLDQLRTLITERKALILLSCTTILLAGNWLVFIIAVESGKILESSLGYFINPLVNALLGRIFLGERMSRTQNLAILLAAAGVLVRTLQVGNIPWIALFLAVSFGLYGLLRKRAGKIEAMAGLTVETALLALPALGYLLFKLWSGTDAFPFASTTVNFLLPLSGIITAIPLIFFAAATQRLRLTTIGFLQYITPTLHLLIAVLLYHEPFSAGSLLSFACIWSGIILYTVDTLRSLRTSE